MIQQELNLEKFHHYLQNAVIHKMYLSYDHKPQCSLWDSLLFIANGIELPTHNSPVPVISSMI
jgi:hypothetical protein